MKSLRVIFYLLMPVFLLAGMYTGLRIWYILLIAQVLMVFAILGLNLWTLRTFSYTQTLEETAVDKGGETALHLSVRNEKPFPFSMMRADVELASPRERTQISFSLTPFSGKEFEFRVAAPYRGVYPIGVTTVQITDILGLLPMRYDMRRLHYYRQPELVVYPRSELLSALYADVTDEKLFGERYLHASESGNSTTGARAYHPGDPLKQIHWKKSIARGELYVRQYEQPVREDLTVVIDNSSHGINGEAALACADTVCEAAACITLHCLSRNRGAILRAICDTKGIRTGENAADTTDFGKVRKWLAQLPFDSGSSGDLVLPEDAAGTGSLVVITGGCSPEFAAEIAEAVPLFASVTLILVGSEHCEVTGLQTIRLPVGCDVADVLVSTV